MANRGAARRIALFVEGDTERGDARRKTLPVFFHNWLDPKLPNTTRVGIDAVKFQGVSQYLNNLPQKVAMYLDHRLANFVVGLVDLYGLPARIDLSACESVEEKIRKARNDITKLVPDEYRNRFRQHFAVHEVEAWLLAYPERWPVKIRNRKVRDQIKKRRPEQVNFSEPPAKFLKRLMGGECKKTVHAKNIFPEVEPQVAIDACPHLKLLANQLLEIARRLQ